MSETTTHTPIVRYPGRERLRELERQVDSLEVRLSPQDFPERIRRLREAVEAGLDFEDHLRAARVLVLAIQEVTDGAERIDALPIPFVDSAIEEMSHWEPWFPFLDPDLQALAWELLDLLHCNRLRTRSSDVSLEASADLVRRSPVPAVRTAARLLRITLEAGLQDPRQVLWLRLVEDHSGFVEHLAFAAEVRATLGMQVALRLESASGTLVDDLQRMIGLHERLGETVGDGVPLRASPVSGRERSRLRLEGTLLTREVMEVQASILNRDPFMESWIELSLARIEAYVDEVASAARILDQLIAKRFCLWDVAQWRARLALARNYPEDAREALDRMARMLPLFWRPGDSFQSPVFRLWEQAGGKEGELGIADPPTAWVEEAARHRTRDLSSLFSRADRGALLRSFWEARRARLDLLLGDLLDASDLDAALDDVAWPRKVRVDPIEAARCALDRLPEVPDDLRGLLLTATESPVPAREVARIFLSWLPVRETRGETLESLLRTFPALRGSRAFALKRLRRLHLSGTTDEISALLDLYEGLPDVPDRVLLDLWLTARELVGRDDHLSWEMIRRGRRIWARLRGDAGRICGEVLRQEAFSWLRDPARKTVWHEMVRTVLDTLPPDDFLERLGRWYLSEGATILPWTDPEGFRIAGLLAGQTRSSACRSVRELLQREVVDRLPEVLASRDWAERRAHLEALLEWGRGDPAVEGPIARWYRTETSGLRPDDPNASEASEIGIWLSRVLRGESASSVRRTTGQHLLRSLQSARDEERQRDLLRRLEALDPQDPSLPTLRDTLPSRSITGRWVVWVLLGISGGVLLVWWLLRT